MLITVNFLRRKCYVELILHTSLPLHFSVMSSAFAITHLWCLPKIRRAFWSLLEQLNGLQVFHALPPYKLGVQDVSSAVILSLFYGGWVTVITSLFSFLFFFNFVYENEYKLEMELEVVLSTVRVSFGLLWWGWGVSLFLFSSNCLQINDQVFKHLTTIKYVQ